jgi:hypothetical protein
MDMPPNVNTYILWKVYHRLIDDANILFRM